MRTTRGTLSLLLLIGCGEGTSGGDSGGDPTGSVPSSCVAVVDTVAWEADPAASTWNKYHADSLTLSCAVADAASGIVFNLAPYSGVGSYELSDGETYAQYLGGVTSAEPGAWVSSTGNVEITRDDGVMVEGTFAFEGTDATLGTTKSVTAGVFALNQGS